MTFKTRERDGGSQMEACLDAIRKYFDTRNEAWLDGKVQGIMRFLGDTRQRAVEAMAMQGVVCKHRAMVARNTPLLRAHTKVKVQPLHNRAKHQDEKVYLVREHVNWVYQDGLEYRVEARVIWHRQSWRSGKGSWQLVDIWESDETNLTPNRLTDLVEEDLLPGSVPEQTPQGSGKRANAGQRKFDRFRAFRYAELWWNGANPEFPQMRDDCTNFVSQCLFAGRIPMDKRSSRAEGWWVDLQTNEPGENWSYSWAVTEAFRRYLLHELGAVQVHHPDELRIGDVIVYDWAGTGQVHHAAIVTDFDDHGDPLVNAHSDPSYHRHYGYLDSPAWTPRTSYHLLHLTDSP